MNDRQDTIEDLFNRLGEQEKQNVINYAYLYDDIRGLISEIRQLQSNWNSLRECIIGVIEGAREELNTIIHTTDSFTYANQCSREFDVIRKNLEIVLDKMNELEGKDKG